MGYVPRGASPSLSIHPVPLESAASR
jgi:hypothetical protein